VTIYSGTDSLCSGDTKVVASISDVTGTEAILTFPEPTTPSSTTFYCAVVTDSSQGSPSGVTKGPIQLNIAPGLSTPTLSISPSSIDYNPSSWPPSGPFTAVTVQWAGGFAPYTVQIFSGSSSSCSADDQPVTNGLVSGVTGSTFTFTNIPLPGATTYYCAVVSDSSVPPSVTESTSQVFTVEPLFAAQAPSLSSTLTEVISPQYEGIQLTITVTWSGGTGPFDVALYQTGTACVGGNGLVPTGVSPNPQTGVKGPSTTFTIIAPNTSGTCSYYANITDDHTTVTSPSTTLTIAPALTSVFACWDITVCVSSPAAIYQGQTESLQIYSSWVGGSQPYTATLYTGSSPSACTTKVSSQSGILGTSTIFSFTSPTANPAYYCVGIADSSTPASTGTSNVLQFSTTPSPVVSLTGASIEAGQSATLAASNTSPGVTPDYYQWFIGSGCVASNAVTAPSLSNSYNTGVLSAPTTYSVLMTDSSSGKPAETSCASATVSVSDGPMGVAAFNGGPFTGLAYVVCTSPSATQALCVIDSDSLSEVAVIPLNLGGGGFVPQGVVADSANNLVYVSGCQAVGTACGVIVVDPSTNSQVGQAYTSAALGVGDNPQGLAVNTGLSLLYVADTGTNHVTVFDISTGIAPARIQYILVGAGPLGVAIDQTTYTAFVTDSLGNTVSVIQPGTYSVTTTTVGASPFGVAVNPANDNVIVTNSAAGTVSVLNGFTYNVIATIKIGDTPQGIDINTAANTAYVADASTGAVTVINLATFAPLASTIPVGAGPYGVAFLLNPANPSFPNLVFVTNNGPNTVSVINPATNTVIATIVVP